MSESRSFDFTVFHEELYPKWLLRINSGRSVGEYSYKIKGPTSLYGTCDALISRYITGTIEDLSKNDQQKWANTINSFQDEETGHFKNDYTNHHQEHATAYAVAALYLIDQEPAYTMKWKEQIIRSRSDMRQWIESVNWKRIWPSSHVVAGVPSALALTGEGNEKFFDWYFRFLDAEADPNSGYWRRGSSKIRQKLFKPRRGELGGSFHFYFMYEHFNREWRYPKKVVDHTLRLQEENGLWRNRKGPTFIDLDGLFAAIRSSRNANWYRKSEVEEAVKRFLVTAERRLNDQEYVENTYTSSHGLIGAIAAVAECQKWFKALVKTPHPWKQSLDKACFI